MPGRARSLQSIRTTRRLCDAIIPSGENRPSLEDSMNKTCFTLVAQVALALHALSVASYGETQKPAFQYEVGDTRISIPSSDEPRVKVFGPESIMLAGKYLEAGAVSWARSEWLRELSYDGTLI